MAVDAGMVRDRDQRMARGKWAGGTEVSCRGGPLNDDIQDMNCSDVIPRTYSNAVDYRRGCT